MSPIAFSAIFCATLISIEAYSTGAPDEACKSMMPLHRNNKDNSTFPASTSPAPFVVLLSAYNVTSLANATNNARINSSRPINVTISSKDGNTKFEGFLIQARSVKNPDVIVGSFQLTNNSTRLLDCLGGVNNTATHSNNKKRTDETLQWLPSANFSGEVKFRATVAKGYVDFWTGVESLPLQVRRV